MNTSNHEMIIPFGNISLKGILTAPPGAAAIVIFSHGSGSSRFSSRNAFVARVLNKSGMATLLIDLLTPDEDLVYENRFDIDLLTARLVEVTNFIHQQEAYKNFKIGYFGASTGAASAINAAERLGTLISAIVSRGGRPDLADADYPLVKAPTLLIVGSLDVPVIELNEEVYNDLRCEKKLVIVEGATHLFEEEGKLEEVAELASEWFQKCIQEHHSLPKNSHHDL
ncbi:alpha/beta hydrolase [Chryseobacterium gotjawalense]|uniref:Alpha/beta hydrolase n=1 Tax=Chryseobacterium gotjawalense TaxID=3042315 RepID=A0ABY8REV1_9FLAO|nr:alpha/beta hydrolase [Chryseobacterium sp. wdc7]WHF52500.1 alpha/beta hydrolase [Chryseobacterium sp. wdc7]